MVLGPVLGLKRGASGDAARRLRVWLNLHYGAKLPALDEVDPLMVAAVRRFQRDHAIPVTGEVDAATEAVMLREEQGFQIAAWEAGAVLPLAFQAGTPTEG